MHPDAFRIKNEAVLAEKHLRIVCLGGIVSEGEECIDIIPELHVTRLGSSSEKCRKDCEKCSK
jgi:hypothetical protein